MRVVLGERQCVVERERGDPSAKDESHLLRQVARALRAQGFDVVKKLMARDGHLVDDRQHYVRQRDWAFCVWNPSWAVCDASVDYNREGSCVLRVEKEEAW